MEEQPRQAYALYDYIPSPVLVVSPDGQGLWRPVYRNPAADALPAGREAELLAAMGESLAAAAEGKTPPLWRGSLQNRNYLAKPAAYPGGLCLITLWDVTEETRRQQERVEAANAALRSALDAANAASQAKSDFLSHMSHDIRTPLNAILGMTAIAQAHQKEPERVEDCLEKIALSSRHLLELINGILDMSRIESGKVVLAPEVFTMADFLHGLMAVVRPQAEQKRQRVELNFSGIRHERVRGDQLRVRQVLINLLTNAVKFTPEEGAISMSAKELERTCTAGRDYAYYEFVVEDTGIGMTGEFLERVFQPFERAAGVERIEGTGLGMTITRSLVEMMNGEIAVESRVGQGTRFTVALPLERVGGESEGLEELRGMRVLAAESDEAARRYLREILEDLGISCDLCGSAWEAGELAARARMEGRDYFAILLDWRLPVVDGIQACGELRAMLGEEIPILLMSSYEWTLTADDMRKHGITAFLPKPLFRSRVGETLAAYTPGGLARRRAAAAPGKNGFPGRRVLLVEDNELNREIGVELLHLLGVEVSCAENGQEAVELFRSAPEGSFDLIFMDLQMPVMDGFQATRAIRALPRADSGRIPIVAMSANAFVEDIRACERAGMNDHVPKPAGLQQLAEVMERYTGGCAR